MKEVSVKIGNEERVYEVPEEQTNDEIFEAVLTTGLEHVGGRPKR